LTNEKDSGTFYHAVVSYKVEDEESKKKIKIDFLIETSNIDNVYEIVNDVLKDSISEFKLTKVVESPVMHVLEEKEVEA
jgi:hypothetical protein